MNAKSRKCLTPTIILYLLLSLQQTWAVSGISADQASSYIGKIATVCGIVASAKYSSRSRGAPTFLNLDKAYPNQIFTALIWGKNRNKFKQAPEQTYDGKKICVKGNVKSYRGVPEIIVSDPSQITIEK